MERRLAFTGAELDLVVELLDRELKELLVEIRHTDTADYRQGLRGRLAMIESLGERARALQAAEVGTA